MGDDDVSMQTITLTLDLIGGEAQTVWTHPLPDEDVELAVKADDTVLHAVRKMGNRSISFVGDGTLVRVRTYPNQAIRFRAVTKEGTARVCIKMRARKE